MKMQVLAAMAIFATLTLAACGAPSTPDFVQQAAMSDMYEIDAGKIASEKGKSEEVKKFGQMMVEAHTKTSEELKGIVEAEKIKVDMPTKLDSKHQGMIDDLNKSSADEFDATYADQQENAHQTAADLFDSYAKDGDNAALKAFAAKTAPVIKEHLEMAKKLEDKTS